jgi:hypothetical protein
MIKTLVRALGPVFAWLVFPILPALLGRTYHETFNFAFTQKTGPDPRDWGWLAWVLLAGPLVGYGFLAGATLGLPDEYVNTAIDIRGYGDKKHKAIMSHRTQLHAHVPERYFRPEVYEQAWYLETFARVNPDGTTQHTSSSDQWASDL